MMKAPFTNYQIDLLNSYQNDNKYHPFTCPDDGCNKRKRLDNGKLLVSKEGLICPCGKYKQDYANEWFVTNTIT